jgi:cytochrome c biogenesis protein CcmG/thiol:disulfide interchange protein DsbE
MNKFLWPLIGFGALVVLLAVGLNLNPRDVPSPLVGKPAPNFELKQQNATAEAFSPAQMRGKVWLLNVWSTWCVSCRQEHAVLVSLSKQKVLPIVGLNYKEIRGDNELDGTRYSEGKNAAEENTLARQRIGKWLNQHGDPYALTVLDLDGRVGIDYGVYGVPESYVIDQNGIIRLKHTGPLTPDVIAQKILPLVGELQRQGAK